MNKELFTKRNSICCILPCILGFLPHFLKDYTNALQDEVLLSQLNEKLLVLMLDTSLRVTIIHERKVNKYINNCTILSC
jgi:hypothetical protein